MGFRKTNEELSLIREAFVAPMYVSARTLSVTFETTAEAISSVLPPPLEGTDRHVGACGIAEYESSLGVWRGGGLFVPARFGNVFGQYVVAMYSDLDLPCFYGRAQLGEPKKVASIDCSFMGNSMEGSIMRHGVQIIRMAAQIDEDEKAAANGLDQPDTIRFNFKYVLKPDASGFEWGPFLVGSTSSIGETLVSRRGTGQLSFGESPHDPIADLEIIRSKAARYSERRTYGGARIRLQEKIDGEAFYPYAFTVLDALDVLHKNAIEKMPAAGRETAEAIRRKDN